MIQKEKNMNKLFKTAAALIISAAMLMPQTSALSFAETQQEAASEQEPDTTTQDSPEENAGKETEDSSSKPVVVGYTLTDKNGKTITSLTANKEFNIKINIKDIGLKTSQINGSADIDFIKSVDSFRGTLKSVTITTEGDSLLEYTVEMQGCKWIGGSTDFGFMIGYLSKGSEYAEMSLTVRECYENTGSSTPSYNVAEPAFKISAAEPAAAIKAGDEGYLELTLKNLGSVEAERILVEVSSSDDILIVDGSGSQDINYLSAGGSKTLKIQYKALEKITASKQSFNVSLRYYYESDSGEAVGSANSTVTVASEISTVDRVYPVVLSEFDLSETVIEPNTEYSGTVTIKNIGSADMKGIFVNFASSNDFIFTGGTSSYYIPTIEQGKSYNVPVKIKTLSALNTLRQDLSVGLKYSYTMGSEEYDGSAESVFTMFADLETAYAPLPVASFSDMDSTIAAGHAYRYNLCIENKGGLDMDNVIINLSGSDGINIASSSDSAFIGKIPAGGSETVAVSFETAAEILSSKQSINVALSYFYTGNGQTQQVTSDISISIDAAVSGAPVIRMTGSGLGQAIVADSEYEYTLTFRNLGEIAVKDIYLAFDASDSLYFLDGTEYAYIGSIQAGETADVKVRFRTTESIAAAKQGITAHITYSYGVTNAEKTAETDASVTIIAAGASDTSGGIAAPNIIIGSYDMGAEQIAAGDSFDLLLDIYNTSSQSSVENIIMTINAGGDINIYGGGNTYYYPTLDAASQITEDIQLKALATAATGTSSVSVSFKYDYLDGGNRVTASSEQTIFIPVYQPDKMTFDVNIPTYSVYAGNEIYITTTYMNKGRSDISNVKAELVGDISALSTSKVIGTVAPGGNGSFDFIVTPYTGGDCEFTIKITYEDATLAEVVREIPVSFYVEEMVWDNIGWDEGYDEWTNEAEGEGGFPWIVLWIGIGVVVVGGVVAIILIVRHKKKKGRKLTENDIDWEDDLDEVLSDKKDETKV